MSAAPAIQASTGAAAGTVLGATPFGWAQLGASLIGGAMGGQPGGPSQAYSGGGGVMQTFDNSGWTVATSGSKATATAGDRGGLTGSGSGINTTALMIVAGLALVGVLLWKR